MLSCLGSLLSARRIAWRAIALFLITLLVVPGAVGMPARAASPTVHPRASAPANGTLFRDAATGKVSLYWDGRLHWIRTGATLDTLGYGHASLTPLTTAIPYGNDIDLNAVAGGLAWPLALVKCDPVLLTLGTTLVAPGQTLAVHGSGFAPGEVVAISPPNSATISIGTDASGAFQINVPIVAAVTAGLHHMFVQGTRSGLFGVQVFYVAATAPVPTMSVVPNPVDRGTNLLVSGKGFTAGELVQIFLAAGAADVVTGASADGAFGPTPIFVPATLSLGDHTVRAYGVTSHRTVGGGVKVVPLILPTSTPSPTPIPVPPTPVPPTPVTPHVISLAVTSSALPGGRIVISGNGFAPGELALIRFNNVVVKDVPTNSAGAFINASFNLPTVLNPGRYPITATGVSSGAVGQAFVTVNLPPPTVTAQLALSAATVSPGAHLTAAGRGFEAGETVLLRLDGKLLNAVTANSSGTFRFGFAASRALGNHTISATGGRSGRAASATFTVLHPVTAGIGILGSRFHRGSTVLVNGNNFLPGEVVLIKFRGRLVHAATADRNGRFFRAAFKIPGNTPYGISTITIVGSRSGRQAKSQVLVTKAPKPAAHVKASPTTLHRGGKLTLTGGGFTAKEIVLISYRGKLAATTRADSHGNLSRVSFKIPGNSPYGTSKITLKGARSGRSATVKVRITAKPSIGISVTPTKVRRGGSLTITGHGFTGGEIVLIYVHGALLQAPKTNSHGSFGRTRLTVPKKMARGATLVLAKGARSGRHAQVKVVIT